MNVINDSLEKKIERLRIALYRKFDYYPESDNDREKAFSVYLLHTFDDTVVIEDDYSRKLYECNYKVDGELIMLGELKEVELAYVEKRFNDLGIQLTRKSKEDSGQLSGPIAFKNAMKRIAYAPVLVPGEPDSDNDVVTAEKIEEVAHEWLASYRNVDYMHTLNNTAIPVESYISKEDMEVDIYGEPTIIPKGSWILACKFSENDWDSIEKQLLTGYSIMGVRRTVLDTAMKSKEDIAFKRTTLADLGDDWIAPFVSVVDEPAVPKAKFFAFKSRQLQQKQEEKVETPATEKSLFAKIKDIINPKDLTVDKEKEETISAEKAGRRYSEQTFSSLQSIYDEAESLRNKVANLLEDASSERQEEENNTVNKEDTTLDKQVEQKSIVEKEIEEVTEVVETIEEVVKEKETEEVAEKSLEDRIAILEAALKAKEVVEEQPVVEEVEKSEETDELQDALKSIEELKEEIKALKSQPNSLEVIEESTKEKVTKSMNHRDAFGRRK